MCVHVPGAFLRVVLSAAAPALTERDASREKEDAADADTAVPPSRYAAAVVADGPVACYRFGKTTADGLLS